MLCIPPKQWPFHKTKTAQKSSDVRAQLPPHDSHLPEPWNWGCMLWLPGCFTDWGGCFARALDNHSKHILCPRNQATHNFARRLFPGSHISPDGISWKCFFCRNQNHGSTRVPILWCFGDPVTIGQCPRGALGHLMERHPRAAKTMTREQLEASVSALREGR